MKECKTYRIIMGLHSYLFSIKFGKIAYIKPRKYMVSFLCEFPVIEQCRIQYHQYRTSIMYQCTGNRV